MSKKYYIQPTGAWGVILWSLALIIIFFGAILQLEIMSLSVIPIVIWILSAVYVFYLLKSSWIEVSDSSIAIKEPNHPKVRTFKRADVSITSSNKWQLKLDFHNHDYFPVSITSTRGILNDLMKRAGDQ